MSKQKQEIVTREVLFVPLAAVEPNPFNPNVMSEEKRLGLKTIMATTTAREFFKDNPLRASPWDAFYGGGKLAPTKKKHADYIFIDGQHRWINAKELKAEGVKGWDEIGIVVKNETEAEARAECYNTNYYRGDTDALKEARLFKAELDEGATQEKIAEKYGHDAGYVSLALSLLTLPKEVQMALYVEDPAKMPLTKSHLLHLVGLPDETAIELANGAMESGTSAVRLRKYAQEIKDRLEYAKAKAEAESHFVMKACPICDGPGEINQDLKTMRCKDNNYNHVSKLKIRNPEAINWGPLDTKESMLKKKIMLDSGKKFSLADVIEGKGKEKGQGSPIKRRNNWFKYEKTIPELLPKLVDFAYNMLVANREAYTIEEISIMGRPVGSKQSTEWRRGFRISAGGNRNDGIDIKLDEKELRFGLEAKEWKKGPHKIRVNVQDIDDDMEDAEARLKLVQVFLDKLMSGTATVEDYPFEAVVKPKRVEGKVPDLEKEPEGEEKEEPEEDKNE